MIKPSDLYKDFLVPAKTKEITKKGQFYSLNLATIAFKAENNLSGSASAVYDLICCLYNDEKGYAFPSVPIIANYLTYNERTIQKAINSLVKIGLLIRKRRKHKNGGDTSNGYIPQCLNMSIDEFKNYKKGDLILEQITTIETNEYSPGEGTNSHSPREEMTTQIVEMITNNEEFTNTSQLPPSNVQNILPDFMPKFLFPKNIPGFPKREHCSTQMNQAEKNYNSNYAYSHNNTLLLSNMTTDNCSLKKKNSPKSILDCKENYQKDHIYATSPGHIQEMYDLIIKVNEDLGFKTGNWRMNEQDLENLIQVGEYEKAELFMNHIIKIATNLKNPKEALSVSYFVKKYKNQWNSEGCGALV